MSMFRVTGQLAKVYDQERKDQETGEITKETRANILGEIPTRDGNDTRLDLQDIRIPDDLAASVRKLVGREISLPVGIFSPQRGRLVVYVPRGSKISPATGSSPA